jgi:hypothetical protein
MDGGKLVLHVRMSDGRVLEVGASRYQTVFELKESIATVTGIYPAQQSLVFGGKVLVNELSLDFYRIVDGARVFMVAVTPRTSVRQKPYELLQRLVKLLDELPAAESSKFTEIVHEVTSIMENPTVQALSRINDDVQRLLDDAAEILQITERPISWKTVDFVARAQDMLLDQAEACPDKYRVLQAVLDDRAETEEEELPEITRLDYLGGISEQPLPNPWAQPSSRNIFVNSGLRVSVGSGSYGRKERGAGTSRDATVSFSSGVKSGFSQQVATLKNMGFSDEKIILQALREANGNVQLAVKLLRNKFM